MTQLPNHFMSQKRNITLCPRKTNTTMKIVLYYICMLMIIRRHTDTASRDGDEQCFVSAIKQPLPAILQNVQTVLLII